MGTRNGLVGSVAEATATDYDVGLGWRTQPTQPFPGKKMMMVMPHHDPCHEALLSSAGFSGEGGSGGPMLSNTSNQTAFMSDICDAAVADVGSGDCGAVVPKTLNHSNTGTFSFDYSGAGGMAAAENARVPFTAAQWQDLEGQTMTYQYMMSSIPVPPQLLIPIPKSPSNLVHSHSNIVNGGSLGMGFSNNSYPEPWRCRRTDGKKWRCSRDVAPDQKYCERHSHKSRPRSRKPVELQAQFINNNNRNKEDTTKPYQKPHFLNYRSDHKYPSPGTMVTATSCEQPRWPEGFRKGETVPVACSNKDYWQQMMQSKMRLNRDTANWDTSVAYGHALQTQVRLNDQCSVSFSPKLTALEGALNLNHTQQKRHFIDAWSTTQRDNIGEINNKCSSSDEKLPLSSLTLPMCGGNETNEESKNAQMGFGTTDSERENEGGLKSQWMSSLSWMSSPPGGPLAEALCLGIATSAKASPPMAAAVAPPAVEAHAEMNGQGTDLIN